MKKIVGIIGGMGPEATVDLVNKIIHYTDAQSDQEHIHMVIDNNTSIKDRSNYIINNNNSPEEELIETAVRLENYGVDFIAMPCNTAHYFYTKIQKSLKIPLVNMIEETAIYIKNNTKNKAPVLLATEGTYKSNIYKEAFDKYDLDIIYPNEEQKIVFMKSIYNFKASESIDILKLQNTLKSLNNKNTLFVLGCTELPLIFNRNKIKYNYIDSTEILAKAVIKKANYKVKK
jgi:aspartate racemase